MIEIFWSPRSSATRVLWLLEEIGVPYQQTHVDIGARPRHDSPEFRSASPLGKVPAIRDGDQTLSGSPATCLYLADRYAAGRLSPRPDASDRAAFLHWMFFVPAQFEPAMMEKFMGLAPNPEATAWGSWDNMLGQLEAGLPKIDWVLGERFSTADVMVGSACELLLRFELAQPSNTMQDYLSRCAARPAYQRAMEKDAAGLTA